MTLGKPPLPADVAMPPTRVRHRRAKIDGRGRVSALCFGEPRAINMRRESWTLTDAGVTCPRCLARIAQRGTDDKSFATLQAAAALRGIVVNVIGGG